MSTKKMSFIPDDVLNTAVGAVYFAAIYALFRIPFTVSVVTIFNDIKIIEIYANTAYIMLSVIMTVVAIIFSFSVVEKIVQSADYHYLPAIPLLINAIFLIASNPNNDSNDAVVMHNLMLWEMLAVLTACSFMYYRRYVRVAT